MSRSKTLDTISTSIVVTDAKMMCVEDSALREEDRTIWIKRLASFPSMLALQTISTNEQESPGRFLLLLYYG